MAVVLILEVVEVLRVVVWEEFCWVSREPAGSQAFRLFWKSHAVDLYGFCIGSIEWGG